MRKCYSCKLPWPDSHFEILDFPICGECKRDWSILLNGMQRSRRKDICSVCRGRARHEVCICKDCTGAANIKAAPPSAEAPPTEAPAPDQIPSAEIWETQSMKLIENAAKQGMDVDEIQAIVVNKIGPNPLGDIAYLEGLLANKLVNPARKEGIRRSLTDGGKAQPTPSEASPGTLEWILSPPPPLPQSELDKIERHSELSYAPRPETNSQIPASAKLKRRF